MGNPDPGFADKAAKFTMTALSAAAIIAAFSTIARGEPVEVISSNKDKTAPSYAAQAGGVSKGKLQSENRNPPHPGISRDSRMLQKDTGIAAEEAGLTEKTAVDKEKEKEQARIARAQERRQVRDQAKLEKRQAEALKLAKRKKAEAIRLAKKEAGKAERIKQLAADILPTRPIAYRIAPEQDLKVINFDQAISHRFQVSGSCLDKGEQGNNIIKDHKGREFLNVIAFWDVLVEPRRNGMTYYYGSIQFPLGSRHPAIIKSTVPGDEIELGCKAGEVLVLKGFETEGVDYTHGLVDAYLTHSIVMPDGAVAFQEEVRQPSFSLINVETGCLPRDRFSRSHVDPEGMGEDKVLTELPVREALPVQE